MQDKTTPTTDDAETTRQLATAISWLRAARGDGSNEYITDCCMVAEASAWAAIRSIATYDTDKPNAQP